VTAVGSARAERVFRRYSAAMAVPRMFRVRMRPGHMMATTRENASMTTAGAGDEIVVTEKVAAFLMKQGAAEVVEVIDRADDASPQAGA
jgi:hypothetical protein